MSEKNSGEEPELQHWQCLITGSDGKLYPLEVDQETNDAAVGTARQVFRWSNTHPGVVASKVVCVVPKKSV